MFQGPVILLLALGYLGALFAAATWGDRLTRRREAGLPRPLIYALSLGVYCTSWTYFGSVGTAARSGFDFLPIYIGPILVFALGWRMLAAIAGLAKRNNIASIADFIATRYGKSEALGALVAAVAVIGIVPYISIQLKAVTASLAVLATPGTVQTALGFADPAFFVAITMAAFAVLFGTRHIDTTEHQDGMIFAIAIESVVKLAAFISVGVFITYAMGGGIGPLFSRLASLPGGDDLFAGGLQGGRWVTLTLLAAFAIILLPRQFHVGVVENAHPADIRRAAWLFPLYLIVINIFVIPIAAAGLTLLPPGTDGDTFVLALPVAAGNEAFALIAFVGGLSASTAMVIVETIALSIMVCNNLVVPILLRRHDERQAVHGDMGHRLILIRRIAIAVILILAYSYYVMIGSSAALGQVGLISFAAVAQLAPAFFGGLVWKRATARGAMAGILAGSAMWAYTLLLPSFVDAGWIGRSFVEAGPLGMGALRPRMLFYMEFDPLTHGVLWSLVANIAAYAVVSLSRLPTPIERIQAQGFVAHDFQSGAGAGFRLWRTAVTVGKLEETVARYIGAERARTAFAEFIVQRGMNPNPAFEADLRLMRFAEHLLASAIGNASSRLVIALMLERHTTHARGAMKLLDDASAAIQHNRDLLQSAIDNVSQGIGVFDQDMTLVCWNSQFERLMRLGPDLARVGAPIQEVTGSLHRNAERHLTLEAMVTAIAGTRRGFRCRMAGDGQVLEVSSNAMPDGGVVATVTDQTESARAADTLRQLNESLERRVDERTAELKRLNSELAAAKAEADAANQGKIRFIAAASHDILQPLNAARLFTASLVERHRKSDDAKLVRNVDASLEAVEDIISALLDISKLDAGAHKPEIAPFRIDELLEALAQEFAPAAREKGLRLSIVPSGLTIESDRKLLRRVLQNLVSNAIKYTQEGRVLMGCRRKGKSLSIEVHDTGPGIPEDQQKLIFEEFRRLASGEAAPPGLGLGLSIVERTAVLLGTPIALRSRPGAGSMFGVTVPVASAQLPKLSKKSLQRRSPGLAGIVSVLVVDNEATLLEGMRELLSGWGCEVHLAKSGAAALKALETAGRGIDIILADYHLDREDGISVIKKLRLKARRPLPAILITADATEAVQGRAMAEDILYFRKPVKPAALRAAMAQLSIRAVAAE